MKTAYLFHLCVYTLPMLAGMGVLFVRKHADRSGAVLRAIALPIVAVAAWLTAADDLAIRQGIWFFGAGKHLGLYLDRVPVEEMLFFLITNSLVGVALALLAEREPA